MFFPPPNLSEVFEAVDIITGERAALKKIKLDDGKEGVSFMTLTKLIILFLICKHIVDPSELLSTSVVSTPNLT